MTKRSAVMAQSKDLYHRHELGSPASGTTSITSVTGNVDVAADTITP